jgi:hypothetical protein
LLERRVGNWTTYTRHGILPVFARYFGAVSTTANDVPVDREDRPSVVSMFDTSWKHGYIVDSVSTPLRVTRYAPRAVIQLAAVTGTKTGCVTESH